jgi:predicted enzyme related to lactoylglutathione lyase
MNCVRKRPVTHLELHTGDLRAARSFYAELCGWRPEQIQTRAGSYLALDLGDRMGGGIVQCPTERPLWLPYVEVAQIGETVERARELGANLLLAPREGPAGWRSVIATPAAGEIGLWQPKR